MKQNNIDSKNEYFDDLSIKEVDNIGEDLLSIDSPFIQDEERLYDKNETYETYDDLQVLKAKDILDDELSDNINITDNKEFKVEDGLSEEALSAVNKLVGMSASRFVDELVDSLMKGESDNVIIDKALIEPNRLIVKALNSAEDFIEKTMTPTVLLTTNIGDSIAQVVNSSSLLGYPEIDEVLIEEIGAEAVKLDSIGDSTVQVVEPSVTDRTTEYGEDLITYAGAETVKLESIGGLL